VLDADRLAAQQMLQRGGVHRRQGQAPRGYRRIVAVGGRAARRGVRVCPDAEADSPSPLAGMADYLRAISSYPSSQAMQAEASRIWHTALP